MDHPEQVNILIVDDEPRNLAVLESILDDPGYRLVRATTGDEALLALVNDDFAALVLDVQMPGMRTSRISTANSSAISASSASSPEVARTSR